VTSVVDNLTKGAAGGAVQWMNRLFDLDEDCGLRLPGLLPA
jgi:N-acetyl-gamma-glutamyl-phosphate reductase